MLVMVVTMMEMHWLMMEMMPKPPRISVMVKISALLLTPPDPFQR
jgi:hypothetical protein